MLSDPIPDLKEDTQALYEKISKKRGELRSLYRYLFHHPLLLEKVSELGSFLRFQGSLPEKITCFVTLCTAAHLGSRFTWDNHIERASNLSIPPEILDRLWKQENIDDSPWSELRDFILSYLNRRIIKESTLLFCQESFGEKGICELVILIGFYRMIIDSTGSLDLTNQMPLEKNLKRDSFEVS